MAAGVQADASDVGVACTVCSTLDFLPLRCQHCQKAFCKDHASDARPSGHGCLSYASTIVTQEEQGRSGDETFKSLLPDRSPKPVETTPEELAKLDKKKAALAILQKNFPQTAVRGSGGGEANTNESKQAKPPSKTVVLLKLKQTAKPLDPSRTEKQVLAKDRRYIFGNTSPGVDKRPLWLPKSCSCGKALDLLATEYKMPNKNNLSTTAPGDRLILAITGIDGEARAVDMGKAIGDLMNDGDEVRIGRGSVYA